LQTRIERTARETRQRLERDPGIESLTAASIAALNLEIENAERLAKVEDWQRQVDRAASRLR